MTPSWPPLSDFSATVGRLATEEDVNAGRAAFLLHHEGKRIGQPVAMTLPAFAWSLDEESGGRQRCVLLQAESIGQTVYYGGWLIDEKRVIAGFKNDFELLAGEAPP